MEQEVRLSLSHRILYSFIPLLLWAVTQSKLIELWSCRSLLSGVSSPAEFLLWVWSPDRVTFSHSAVPCCPAAPPQTKDTANQNVSMGVTERQWEQFSASLYFYFTNKFLSCREWKLQLCDFTGSHEQSRHQQVLQVRVCVEVCWASSSVHMEMDQTTLKVSVERREKADYVFFHYLHRWEEHYSFQRR